MAHWRLAACYYFHADIRRCHEIAGQIVERAEAVADRLSASEGRCALGETFAELGVPRRSRAIHQGHLALARIIRGWARAEQGAVEEGLDELRRGLAAYEATGARLWRAQSLGLLAQMLARADRHDEALDTAVDALNLVQKTGEKGTLPELLRIEGDLLFARASRDGSSTLMHAEKSLTRALTMARAQHARSWELQAATNLARLYWYQKRPAEAVPLVTSVVDWFTEGHDTSDLRRLAQSFLSEVADTSHSV